MIRNQGFWVRAYSFGLRVWGHRCLHSSSHPKPSPILAPRYLAAGFSNRAVNSRWPMTGSGLLGSGAAVLKFRARNPQTPNHKAPKYWSFRKLGGTLFWGPYNKDPTISGTLLGSPHSRKLPYPSCGLRLDLPAPPEHAEDGTAYGLAAAVFL